jgi:hypothetical protein
MSGRKILSREKTRHQSPAAKPSRMPNNSFFFERLVPSLLVLLGVVTVALILFALAVLFGYVAA